MQFVTDIQGYFRTHPACGVLCVYILGILASGCGIGGEFLCGILAFGVSLIWQGRKGYRVVSLFVLGMVWGHYAERGNFLNYRGQLPRENCGAQVYGYIADLPSSNGYYLSAPFHLVSFRTGEKWQKCRGKIQLMLPLDSSVQWGDCLRAEGGFLAFQNNSYGRWNKSLGIRHRFYVTKILEAESTERYRLARWLNSVRESLARRLVRGISDTTSQGLYKAMIFGMRTELSPEVKAVFVRSATVHLFSISGLHVGLFTFCISIFFRCLPLRRIAKSLCIVWIVGGYVLLCGGMPSALRAYHTLLALLLSDCLYRPRSAENALAFSGFILLLVNPLYLLHIGFIFSFTLVGILLRGGRMGQNTINVICEKRFWIVHGMLSRIRWRLNRGQVSSWVGCVTAWLGCSGLMMVFNQMISWSSLLTNLMMIPIAFLLVSGALLKILLSFIMGDLWLAFLLEKLLRLLLLCSYAGAYGQFYSKAPLLSLGWGVVYYGVLIGFLSLNKYPRLRWGCACILGGIIAHFVLAPYWLPSKTLMKPSSNGGPACIARIDKKKASILSAGDRSSAVKMLSHLQQEGIEECTLKVGCNADISGAWYLEDKLNITSVVVAPKALKGRKSRVLLNSFRKNGIHIAIAESPVLYDSNTGITRFEEQEIWPAMEWEE